MPNTLIGILNSKNYFNRGDDLDRLAVYVATVSVNLDPCTCGSTQRLSEVRVSNIVGAEAFAVFPLDNEHGCSTMTSLVGCC
jgi:hypothetical protein